MSNISTAAPSKRVLSPFGYPGDRVTAYEAVSVTTYESGARRASHARLDTASNRMTFTRLSNPSEEWDCANGTAHDLANAAAEALQDAHAQATFF